MDTAPERLSPDDLATHQAALAQMQAAQTVWRWWSGLLAQRYQLGPTDRIVEDGAIIRPATPAAHPLRDSA